MPVKVLRVLALLLGLSPALPAIPAALAAPPAKVYVFYPTLIRPLALQEALAEKCPGLSITVFGRLTDFQAKVAADPPDALLAQAAVLAQFASYRPRLQGLRKGSPTESYVLLSIDKPADPAKMEGATLGVVGLLERKPMADFVGSLVAGSPRLDRVTKVEDLLPLLTFRAVSAVLVSEPIAREFRRKSQANLVSARLEGAKVGLVSLAVRRAPEAGIAGGGKGAGVDGDGGFPEQELVKAVLGLGAGEMELLGVDAWR